MAGTIAPVVVAVLELNSLQLPPVEDIPVDERLWTAQLTNGSNEGSTIEYRRLEVVCGARPREDGLANDKWASCVQRNAESVRYQIATLHAGPSETSEIVATVFEELRFADNGDSVLAWSVEPEAAPSEIVPWPESAHAFDHGLHVAGVQRQGNWVRLLDSVPVDGWLRISPWPDPPEREPLYVYVEPLEGQIVNLRPLMAQWPDGSSRPIPEGAYLMQRIARTNLEFRAEIPSDFSCGAPVIDPTPLPPILRASTPELFDPDGSPRFFTTYTKGC